MNKSHLLVIAVTLALVCLPDLTANAILAGGENSLPADSPALRLDVMGAASSFNAVGALAISSGGFSCIGSGTAISPHWVLTAGHNVDLNDNGSGYSLVGVNTFIEGYGGRFGDIGGGVVLEPYLDWITQTTGLAVPEPSVSRTLLAGLVILFSQYIRRRRTIRN